jgi:thiamine-monophosphate kinase
LAVNLSDLAAMGATPVSITLALTLPKVDEEWLQAFSQGLNELTMQYAIDIIGGDTTSGPLTLTLQAMGLIPKGQALKRSSAQVGDFIYVTGCLGDAGLGLKIEQGYTDIISKQALKQFHQPQAKIKEGLSLRDYASACIDLSDGLASDLKHIVQQSGVGALLDWAKIPCSIAVKNYIQKTGDWMLPLSAGEDYQLCFTVNPNKVGLINIACTQIGMIEAEPGIRLLRFGILSDLEATGFEHFS